MAALSHSSLCNFIKSPCHPKVRKYLLVRSQSFPDEGKSANMVDANLVLLRERIEELRRKEMLEKKPSMVENGWKYNSRYDEKHKKHTILLETMQVLGLVGSSVGAVFLFGSLCIFLVSFVVHLNI